MKEAPKNRTKLQSAMEYLTTYGWTLLVLALILASMFVLGLFNSNNYTPTAKPGACYVLKNQYGGTSTEGTCTGALPEFVTQFNGGTLSYVSSSYVIGTTSQLTLSVWIYQSSLISNNPIIIAEDHVSPDQGWALEENGGQLYGAFFSPSGSEFDSARANVMLGSWQDIVITYNGLYPQLYVNAVQYPQSGSGIFQPADEPIVIGGGNSQNPSGEFVGYISNVQVYSRALQQNLITSLYQEGVGGIPIDLQYLVGWWPLNGNVNDYSGNNYNGQASSISYVSIFTINNRTVSSVATTVSTAATSTVATTAATTSTATTSMATTSMATTATTSTATTTLTTITSTTTIPSLQPTSNAPGPWTLVFDDEFTGSTLNLSKWAPNWFGSNALAITSPVNNYELECYNPSQATVGNGYLSLNAVAASSAPGHCGSQSETNASGMIMTYGKFYYSYGYAEAEIWLPGNANSVYDWPAWWTDGEGVNWPATGEIDIMEGLSGALQYHVHTSCTGSGSGNIAVAGDTSGWHTYAADWEPGSVTFYYDGNDVGAMTTASNGCMPNTPQFLILNLALGGAGGKTVVPSSMIVKYVRVWQHVLNYSGSVPPTVTLTLSNGNSILQGTADNAIGTTSGTGDTIQIKDCAGSGSSCTPSTVLASGTTSTTNSMADLPAGSFILEACDTTHGVCSATDTVTITSTAVLQYVPITITNLQSSATPVPFQEMLVVHDPTYSPYINSGWSNVEFTSGAPAGSGGTPLQAWVENNAVNTAVSTRVWVNLPNGLGVAGSGSNSITIYMNMMTSNVMSASGPTGEAPQLSTTYGQYDNGADVFNNYWNFAGTSLTVGTQTTGGGWSAFCSNTSYCTETNYASQNNGLSISYPSGYENYDFFWASTFTTSSTFDWYGTPPAASTHSGSVSSNNNGGFGFGFGNDGGDVGEVTQTGLCYPGGSDGCAASTAITFYTIAAGTGGSATAFTASRGVWSTILSGGSLYQQFNYSTALTKSGVSASENIGWGYGYATLAGTFAIQWARIRSSPPNGVMPSPGVSFGGRIVPTLTLNLCSAYEYQGQYYLSELVNCKITGSVTSAGDQAVGTLYFNNVAEGSTVQGSTNTVSHALSVTPGTYAITISTLGTANYSAENMTDILNIINSSTGTGFNGSPIFWGATWQEYAEMQATNITYQRTDLFNDTYQGYPAEILNWSKSRKIIGIIDYNMICGPHGNDTCPSWGLGTWNGAVANAIKWYPEVHIWEIWNEPQYGYSQSGYLTNDLPYNYSQMVKSAYRLIKVHNATDTVLCFGGDNIYSGGDGYDASFYQWAQLVWSNGTAPYCDAISLHAYTSYYGWLLNQTPPGGQYTLGQVFNQSLAAYESLTGKPIWITEYGMPEDNSCLSEPCGLQQQAEFDAQATALFISHPYVRAAVVYNLNDPSWGLINGTSGAIRPSYYAFGNFSEMVTGHYP